jgi:hypothetical protein
MACRHPDAMDKARDGGRSKGVSRVVVPLRVEAVRAPVPICRLDERSGDISV